ncbi:MAG TPA: hypothetical protein DCZ95_13725 [Verrucomicrobia bacterium]|nr:MAG: hypothetical protein A2X46_02145 [Lentisphaerae bacterium GWF2_57_35]HBA85144.1 hypothetical protein [Verrucomicrobiota bacterium]
MRTNLWIAAMMVAVMSASMTGWAAVVPIRLESAYTTLTPVGEHQYNFTVHTKIMGPLAKQTVILNYKVNGGGWNQDVMELVAVNTNASLATYQLSMPALGPIQFNFSFKYAGGEYTCNDYDKSFSLTDDCSMTGSGVVGFKVNLDWAEVYRRLVPLKVGNQIVAYLPYTGLKGEILAPTSDSAISVRVRYFKPDGSYVDVDAKHIDSPDCGGSLTVWAFDVLFAKMYASFEPAPFSVYILDQYGKKTFDDNFGMKYPAIKGSPLD